MENNKTFMTPNALWQVTTEGDCEGRSTRNLGIYRGNWYDIALHLADKCCYSLNFKLIDESKFTLPKTYTRDKVDVSFNDCIGIPTKEMLITVPEYVDNKEITFERGRWDGHITVCRPRSEEEKAEAIRAKAMEKVLMVLSKEEREALGLK